MVYHHVGRVETSSRGPDHQQQRQQRVYQYLGVQQALVLFQINRKRSRFITSLLKNIRPSGRLTYIN